MLILYSYLLNVLVDILDLPPEFLRRLVGSQVVGSPLDLTQTDTVRTVGGQTICVDTSQERVTINTFPIKQVLSVESSTVIILDKLLFVKSKDFEIFASVKKVEDNKQKEWITIIENKLGLSWAQVSSN